MPSHDQPIPRFRPLTRRRQFFVLGVALIVLTAVWLVSWRLIAPEAREQAQSTSVRIGGPFQLTDQDGRPVSAEDFRGRPMVVYFGYTYCPDICPTTLQTISEALDSLGQEGRAVAFLFITVDPARDTPEHLKEYVQLYDPAPIGLTGSQEAIAAIAQSYRVYYQRHDGDDPEAYIMDHSTFAYLMDSDGEFVEPISYGATPEEVAAKIRTQL